MATPVSDPCLRGLEETAKWSLAVGHKDEAVTPPGVRAPSTLTVDESSANATQADSFDAKKQTSFLAAYRAAMDEIRATV